MVMSRDLPHLAFKLKMLSREKSYDNPVQRWEFVSDYAAKDYTGSYYIKLIPCVANMVSFVFLMRATMYKIINSSTDNNDNNNSDF